MSHLHRKMHAYGEQASVRSCALDDYSFSHNHTTTSTTIRRWRRYLKKYARRAYRKLCKSILADMVEW